MAISVDARIALDSPNQATLRRAIYLRNIHRWPGIVEPPLERKRSRLQKLNSTGSTRERFFQRRTVPLADSRFFEKSLEVVLPDDLYTFASRNGRLYVPRE